MNLTSRILYDSLSRILWSLAMSFIIYACVTSYGGFVNEFFSWKVWQPLSRLSFCAYLIQVTIFIINMYSSTHPFHLQWTNFVRFIFIQVLIVMQSLAQLNKRNLISYRKIFRIKLNSAMISLNKNHNTRVHIYQIYFDFFDNTFSKN